MYNLFITKLSNSQQSSFPLFTSSDVNNIRPLIGQTYHLSLEENLKIGFSFSRQAILQSLGEIFKTYFSSKSAEKYRRRFF